MSTYKNELECDDEEYESDDSVAAGLGLIIDDDGNWVPENY